VHGSTRKFVWGGSYQNHQYTESSKNDHALGKPAHTKLRLRGRCPPIVHGCLTKENSCPSIVAVCLSEQAFATRASSYPGCSHS